MKIKTKRLLTIIICIIMILSMTAGAVITGINAYVIYSVKPYILSYDDVGKDSYDCVLILGAGLWDGEPSPMLRERLNFGIKAYNTGCTDRILMSGDHGQKEYDEVNTMKRTAVGEGIAPENIFLDHAGFSTYESMYRAGAVFNVEKPLIVTQKYHLYRAVYDARKLGLDAYGYAADELRYPLSNDIRESLARVKDFIWCIIKPEPTYLGETIPIWGDASASDDRVYS